MSIESPIVKSGAFVVSQFRELQERLLSGSSRPAGPAITLSHQTGSGLVKLPNSWPGPFS